MRRLTELIQCGGYAAELMGIRWFGAGVIVVM